MIAHVSQAIREAGGSVIDARFFSNFALFISAEVEAANLAALRDALVGTELNFASKSLAALDRLVQTSATQQPVVPIHLVGTFIHSEPDLHIPVPAVPG